MSQEKSSTKPGNRKTKPIILCVDDVTEILNTLREQVSTYLGDQFRIEIAESGDEALELLRELHEDKRDIAVIISDYLMPNGINGDKFLIEAHMLYPNTRKIMLTGEATRDSVVNVVNKARLYRYIAKPWEAEDLRVTVEEAAQSFLQTLELEEKNKILKSLSIAADRAAQQPTTEALLDALTETLMQFSGATRVAIVGVNDTELNVLCDSGEVISVQHERPEVGIYSSLPARNIREVASEGQVRNLGDAYIEGNEDYFKEKDSKSVLIIPAFKFGKVNAVFYFENPNFRNFFSSDRVDIVELMCSNAGVALDNARSFDSLEENVAESNTRLSEAERNLVSVESHKDKMIHIVSHDIRSPLSGIVGLAKMLTEKSVASDSETVIKYGGIISESVNSVIKFVEDILDVAKLESGTIVLNKSENDLSTYLKQIGGTFEPLTLTKKVELKYNIVQSPTISFDTNKLNQAVSNLLANSIKFTKSGGSVTLGADIETIDNKKMAVISIKDTGIGIPADQLSQIFDKFNKFQRSGSRGEKGTGLGMSIAKEIIDIHHGNITVESEVGKGTTFKIYLPL